MSEQNQHSIVEEARRYLDEVGEFPANPETTGLIRGLLEQFDAVAEAVEALWITRITTGETAVVNTRELTELHKLFRDR